MSMSYNFIAIEGNIGVGKTTLAKKLSKDYRSRLILEEFFLIILFLVNSIILRKRMHFLWSYFLWLKDIIN